MEKYFLLVLFVIFALWYLSYSATRLDRLHHRVETSWANLDGLLQRRAAVALEIARSDIADPASSLLLLLRHIRREMLRCRLVHKLKVAYLAHWGCS
jgi:hypothetical protein